MSTPESEAEERRVALERVNALTGIDPSSMVRQAELGNASFAPGQHDLETTIALFAVFAAPDAIDRLPLVGVRAVSAKANETLELFARMNGLNLEAPEPIAGRDALVGELDARCRANEEALSVWVAFLRSMAIDPETRSSQIEALQRQLSAAVAGATQAQTEAEQSRDAAQSAALKSGVAQQAKVFADEAEKHDEEAGRWLTRAMVIGALTVLYVVAVYFVWDDHAHSNKAADVVSFVAGRLVGLSLLVFVLGYSIRQISAHRHNQVVNTHRQNALSTFQAFVEGSDDPMTKDAVLLEATRSIFAPTPTGYLRHEAEAQSSNTMVEVVRRTQASQ